MIFNTIGGGGIGEYQYVETKSISNNAVKTISFNGSGIIFAAGHYITVKKINGVNSLTGCIFLSAIDDSAHSIVAPFENGITIEYKENFDYVYYKKI